MILALMGIIFLGIGVAFFIIGRGDPLIGSTFTIISYTFVPVGILLLFFAFRLMRGSARRQVLLQTGLDGSATVTALSDTGITVNDSPMANIQLLVQIPGRTPYPVTKRMTLPRLMVGRIAPGVTIPVKVDPADAEEIVIDWSMPNVMPGGFGSLMGTPYGAPGTSGQLDQATLDRINRTLYERGMSGTDAATAAQSMAQSMVAGGASIEQVLQAIGRAQAGQMSPGRPGAATPMASTISPGAGAGAGAAGAAAAGAGAGTADTGFGLLDPKQAERLAAVGYPGRATVDWFQDTGVASGDARLYTLQLTVHVDGRPDAQVRHAAMVPQRATSRVTQGASLPVRVDPLDASQLLVEWDNG